MIKNLNDAKRKAQKNELDNYYELIFMLSVIRKYSNMLQKNHLDDKWYSWGTKLPFMAFPNFLFIILLPTLIVAIDLCKNIGNHEKSALIGRVSILIW